MICVSDEHSLNMLSNIFTMLPSIINDVISMKAFFPIEITEDGIVICSNALHPRKASFPIVITEEGIKICFNDKHPLKLLLPIDVTEEGMVIFLSEKDNSWIEKQSRFFGLEIICPISDGYNM